MSQRDEEASDVGEHGEKTPADDRQHIWDNPRNVDRFVNGFYVCCVILVLLDFIIDRHASHPWEELPAFHALYGFGACWILVVIAKQMRRVLMRDEDYYDGP
jgi:hypothetical protein